MHTSSPYTCSSNMYTSSYMCSYDTRPWCTMYYEVRFGLTDPLFCLTKYELVRTTKFTRLSVTTIIRKTVRRGELIFLI